LLTQRRKPAKDFSAVLRAFASLRGNQLPSMEDREEFLTAKQVAAILQVSESTVRRLAARRRIPSVRLTPRIIRFHLDAVREALEVPRHRIRHGEYTERVDDAQLSFDDFFLS
jgi:excisionase family DNA binding protein